MGRPISRVAALIVGATAVGFLVAGCSSISPTIIAPPPSASPVNPAPNDSIETAVNLAIQSELAQAAQTASDGAPALVQVELNALSSARSLGLSEAFSTVQTTGANQIAKREALVNTLIADVKANKYLSGVDPAGRSLSATLLSILDGVDGQLAALGERIASDSVPDVLRSDVLSIGTSTRVAGVYEPMTHLAIAGGDELFELNFLSSQQQTFAIQVAARPSSDPNHAEEASYLSDLASSIASARATITSGVSAVMSLTASGYPANKPTILNVRSALIGLRAPLGKISEANTDAKEILALLTNG
jgi:hypothetical protein